MEGGTLARPMRVLVADDEPANVEFLGEILTGEGYLVEGVGDGREALERALAAPPDLVLLDVNMPRLDGLETCRLLKADPATHLVPVVLITGLTARDDRIRGLRAGCDDFLTKPVDVEQLLARTRNLLHSKQLVDELERAENVLVSLATALEAKDAYTRGHSERVAHYAEALGGAAGLDRAARHDLRRAGLLHDIGKIGTPEAYLRKPGKLSRQEYEAVKLHPGIGFEICKPLRSVATLLPLIRGHHERLDGGGYPDGLRGEAIPVSLRCLTTADIYDALTSNRPYRTAMDRDAALGVMRDEARAGRWDLRLIDLLSGVLEREA